MWLLTGGAGYIGSHVARALIGGGLEVVVLDNLSSGFRQYVPEGAAFVQGSVADPADVARVFDEHAIEGVVHLAGLKAAPVSVEQPLEFYRENVGGMEVLLSAVAERGIENFLFSSSASWYGTIDSPRVTEDAPAAPENPYGETKVISEWMLRSLARATPQLRQTSLRYFNVVGSGPPELADHAAHNLFPRVFRMLSAGENPVVFGDDYPTPDGSCVRDYIHVVDLADAHLAAALALQEGRRLAPAYNVGRGLGSSVFEVMDELRAASGIDFSTDVAPRRPGDPARIVGDVTLIGEDLGWHARHELPAMTTSAWAAWQKQLELYGGPPPTVGHFNG